MNSRYRLAVCAVLVAAASFTPYWQTRHFDFINLDDWDYVVSNESVQQGLTVQSLRWAFGSMREYSSWHPVTVATYLADVSVFGVEPGPMHLVNAAWHAVGAVLALLLLLRLTGSLPAALVGALFWSLHPLRVEAVAWIASRKDVVSVPLLLAACLSYLRALDAADGSRGAARWYAATTVWHALALMSKPTTVVFPVLMLVLEGIRTGRIRGRGLRWPLLLTIGGAYMAVRSQGAGGALEEAGGRALYQRLVNAVAGAGASVLDTVWPSRLAVPHLFTWPVDPVHLVVGIVVVVSAASFFVARLRTWGFSRDGITLRGRPEWNAILGGVVWFGAAFVPASGIVGFGWHARADRFSYLPGIGLAWMVAVGFDLLRRRFPKAIPAATAAAVVLLSVLCLASWRQAAFWKNDETLFTRALAMTGENFMAHGLLGTYYLGNKDLERASEHYERCAALREYPQYRAQRALVAWMLKDEGAIDAQLKRARELEGSDYRYGALISFCNGLKSHLHGNHELAKTNLWRTYHAWDKNEIIYYPLAAVYEALGEERKAERLRYLCSVSPMYRHLRNHAFSPEAVEYVESVE